MMDAESQRAYLLSENRQKYISMNSEVAYLWKGIVSRRSYFAATDLEPYTCTCNVQELG